MLQFKNQINEYETKFVYHEIYTKEVYLTSGIKLSDNPVVFDIGANIGIFTNYIMEKRPQATVYAFEPSPDVYNCFVKNNHKYGDQVKAFNIGLSNKNKKKLFQYYPGYSVISGFYAHTNKDMGVIKNGARSISNNKILSVEDEKKIEGRFAQKQQFYCQTKTISDLIKENKVKNIDLLKIDAEKSELDILKGIKSADWKKIYQIVVEVHGERRLQKIEFMLKNYGFNSVAKIDDALAESKIFTVYASAIGRGAVRCKSQIK